MNTRSRRTYDHRIKEQIIRTGNPDLFPELQIPRSTALSWIRRGVGEVISLDDPHELEAALRSRIVKLESRISMLTAVLRLVRSVCSASPVSSSSSTVFQMQPPSASS